MYVFDATPLIYLATVDRLDVVALLDGECIVPDRVYEEVVTTGVDEGHPDARRIERAVEGGMFQRVAIEMDEHFERFADADGLSAADAAVLSLAHQRDAIAVMDDSYAAISRARRTSRRVGPRTWSSHAWMPVTSPLRRPWVSSTTWSTRGATARLGCTRKSDRRSTSSADGTTSRATGGASA